MRQSELRGIGDPQIRRQPQASLLRFIGWYFLINTLFFWGIGSSYLLSILASTSLFHNSIANYASPLGQCFVLFFTWVNFLSYMMFLAFIPACFLWPIAFLTRSNKCIWIASVLAAWISLICLLLDARVFSMFKFHLNATILAFFLNENWRHVFDLSQFELTLFGGILVGLLLIQILVAVLVWRWIVLPGRFKIGRSICAIWVGGILFSYLTLMLSMSQNNNLFSQQIPSLPLFNQLFVYLIPDKNAAEILRHYSEHHFAQPSFSNDPFDYPKRPLNCHVPHKPYNLILVMVDSLRFDSLNAQVMPNTMKFAQKSWQFKHHISGGNATQPGLFSLFYSLPSNYWTAALKQKKPPVLIDLLRTVGYETRIIWSSEMYNPPFHQTIYQNLPNLDLNGAPGDDIGDWDRHTSDEAVKFLSQAHAKQPFFLNLFYDAPHGYCRAQSYPTPFHPALKYCSRIGMSNEIDPIPYHNRYLNAVWFVDGQIAQVLREIERRGYLENSVVIMTSDHGQEFNDNRQNYWGHASNFTSAQVHVPLIIHWPGEPPEQYTHQTSSYDLVPTLLQRLFHCENAVQDYSVGYPLLQTEGRLPYLLVGSYVNMGVIEPDRLTVLESSGQIRITDRHARPLKEAQPRMSTMNQALKTMRKYFQS